MKLNENTAGIAEATAEEQRKRTADASYRETRDNLSSCRVEKPYHQHPCRTISPTILTFNPRGQVTFTHRLMKR
jgi:hypothetical protein